MFKKAIVIVTTLIVLMLVVGCNKKEEESVWKLSFPQIQDMDEFRRSFQHNGEAFVTSSFEESVIKSSAIVKARMLDYTIVEDGYVIYHFDIIDEIKNIEKDDEIFLYEPELANEEILYQSGREYVLILARSTDIYYENPVFNNFGQMVIGLEDNIITTATRSWGSVNLLEEYEFIDYESLKETIKDIRTSNTSIKDGYYNFYGRFLDTDDYNEVLAEASMIAEIQLDEILYENAVMKECRFIVNTHYKGNSNEYVIVTIPTYIDIEIGDVFLAPLFFDANYTLASITGFSKKGTPDYNGYVQQSIIYRDTVLKDELVLKAFQQLYGEYLDYPEKFIADNQLVLDEEDETLDSETESVTPSSNESESNTVVTASSNDNQEGTQPSVNISVELPVTTNTDTKIPASKNQVYQDYYEINNDFVGWVKIADTVIDYPVLQGKDNAYYLKKNLYKQYSKYGSISLDYRCDIDRIERNTMIFGHNMKDVKMFNELINYKDKEFFDNHRYITFNTLNEKMTWEVFSVYVVDGGYGYALSYPLRSEQAFDDYVYDIYEKNMYDTGVEITYEDKLLTLVTCSYEFDNARTIVHARLISREPWE